MRASGLWDFGVGVPFKRDRHALFRAFLGGIYISIHTYRDIYIYM